MQRPMLKPPDRSKQGGWKDAARLIVPVLGSAFPVYAVQPVGGERATQPPSFRLGAGDNDATSNRMRAP